MLLDDVALVADDQRHHDLHARNRSGQRYRRWTSSKVWIREAIATVRIEEPREVRRRGPSSYVDPSLDQRRRGIDELVEVLPDPRGAHRRRPVVPRRRRRRRSSAAARSATNAGRRAALGQHGVERHAVEEVLVPVASREGEPRRVDGQRREPEPRVRGHEEARRLDEGELLEDRPVERVDRVPAATRAGGRPRARAIPLAVRPLARRAGRPARTTTSGKRRSSASRIGEPGGRRRIEVPGAAPGGHHRDRRGVRRAPDARARARARAARAGAAGAARRRAAPRRRRRPPAGRGSAAPPPRSSAGGPRSAARSGSVAAGWWTTWSQSRGNAPERAPRAADRGAEARVRHAEDLGDERARTARAPSATRRFRTSAIRSSGIARVVALTAAERLDHVPDGVRVPVVDEERRRRRSTSAAARAAASAADPRRATLPRPPGRRA